MISKNMKDVTDAAHTCFAFQFSKSGWGNLTPVISHAILSVIRYVLFLSKLNVSAFKKKIYFDN